MSILNAPEGLIKLLVKKYDLFEVSISEDFGKRMAECSVCPSSFNKRVGQIGIPTCRECLCVIEAKCLIAREKCPLGKW